MHSISTHSSPLAWELSQYGVELVQLPVLADNYLYLYRDHAAGVTAAIDPAEAAPALEALQERGWRLDYILNTHHHGDHVSGNLELAGATGCLIAGYAGDAARIPGIGLRVEEGERVTLGRFQAQALFLPGHTLGHIAWHIAPLNLLFCGDTLFSLGCGRLFEGTPAQMFASLEKLRRLPEATWIACAHEYTAANGRFALTVEPGNPALHARLEEAHRLRAEGLPTVPVRLGEELHTNPFLRCDSQEIRRMLGMESADGAQIFAELRARKDRFR